MTIAPFAAGSYVNNRTTSSLLNLKGQLDTLTTQLVSGRTSETYGGLGAGRITSLSAHETVSRLDGYITAAKNAKTRVDLASTSLSQIKTVSDNTRTRLLTMLQTTTPTGVSNSVALARGNFDAAIDALNQQSAGQYIFSGRTTDIQPVVSSSLIFNGDRGAGLAGLKDLIAEQKTADLGPGQNGRLSQTPPAAGGTVVSLTESMSVESRANFGFRLVNVSSSNGAGVEATIAKVAATGGEPNFTTQPADGAKVRVAVLMDDGSQRVIDMTARSNSAPASENTFAIGGSADDAETNLKAALKGILGSDAKIASIQSANPPGASLVFTPATAAGSSLTLDVKTPVAGDTISVKLGMRDGTETVITLTASSDTTDATAFKIGATSAATAANLNQALELALKQKASTELAASSTQRAAEDFFDGSVSPGLAPRRVSGDGYASTASSSTVIWYRGDDTASDPRSTATVQVGSGQMIGIGAQANEKSIRETLAGLAALASNNFTDASTGKEDVARFQAAATRSVDALAVKPDGTSVADLVTAFGLASSSMANAQTQAQSTKGLVQASIDGIENASIEEVAAKLINLQTQLQASYQVTSMISKLTLANYLS